jgi:hypothetical protein
LSGARDRHRQLEGELAEVRAALLEHAAAVTARDARLAELEADLAALEQENAGFQDQVIRAYQKMRTDEATVARARKAMAIALTLLDDPPRDGEAPGRAD